MPPNTLLAAGSAAAIAVGSLTLPPPEGPLPVGRTQWIVTDSNRTDPFDGPHERRIEVVAWYPAGAGGRETPAPYLLDGADEVRNFATLFGNAALFDDVAALATHAKKDAPPRPGRDRLPLLLFSHGYTSVPSSATALLEDLASRGYVILSIVHPYESTAATVAEGTVVSMLDSAGKLRQPIQDVFSEWRTEDAVLNQVTSASNDAERIRLLREYLGGLGQTHVALRRWVDDARAVIAHLSSPPPGAAIGRVIARADVRRFGVFGHSMGGVLAAELCLTEKRCAAVLNLDGSPQYGSMIDTPLGRPLLMTYSARRGRLGVSDVIYKRAASQYYRVDVADTLHLDFTDMALWPALRDRRATGDLPAEQAIAVTRTIVREFFDQELRGRRSKLLNGEHRLEGVEVKRP
jgi:pimeloyl-ACP methyl ester carboxylesterase